MLNLAKHLVIRLRLIAFNLGQINLYRISVFNLAKHLVVSSYGFATFNLAEHLVVSVYRITLLNLAEHLVIRSWLLNLAVTRIKL